MSKPTKNKTMLSEDDKKQFTAIAIAIASAVYCALVIFKQAKEEMQNEPQTKA